MAKSLISKFTPKVKLRVMGKSPKVKQKSEKRETDITEYIQDGVILYPKLLKDEINKFDKELLLAAKKSNSISGEKGT